MLMLIPQAWGAKHPMGPDPRGFFEYHAGRWSWDGAGGGGVHRRAAGGASLDRNGLRPVRHAVTKDGFMVLASEAGVLDLLADQVAEKGSLRPGTMLLADLGDGGRLMKDAEIRCSGASAAAPLLVEKTTSPSTASTARWPPAMNRPVRWRREAPPVRLYS